MHLDSDHVRFFDASGSRHELLGGKCASLVTMTAAGLPVPPGFAVPTVSYDAFVAQAGIRDQIRSRLACLDPDDVDEVDSVSAAIRDLITSRPVPERMRRSFLEAYRQLQARFAAPVPVAVRSSATAEDLSTASFAGQQDTYLWLTSGEDVVRHIRECWASLYTSRAIIYRLRNAVSDEGLSMSVAVQKMVNARVSGVAITMNPATGDRSKIALDASYGVGEMVVSGRVTPDSILLDKVMLTVTAEIIGEKHAELVPDTATGRLVERAVDEQRRRRRSLTDDEVVAVAAMAKRAERLFGCPQDIEWAFDADLPDGRNLLLLQSRPETVHSSRPAVRRAVATSATPRVDFLLGLTNRTAS
ncbi:PEP/pyruvate-binding domain-containing protein [Micromonospora auratinigra]|uniref:Phosphoenolpyruvate synthase n=1 Tax=Micromonospora auratinigra TaxID=261654 RepID=A0A1A8Z4L7_9ACTN|nr:PEP/pyruvate-binding domain-containing protein [Micromonospora auratinigra]SBT38747.1 pyruvate, water dikinase [Micromonospora auratinigra]